MKCTVKQIITSLLTVAIVQCFQFQAPYPSCTDLTINKVTSCSFILYRNTDINLNPTQWDTTLVPAGSTIILHFPSQYTLSGSETCTAVDINSNFVTGYSCAVSVSLKSITISGAIPTSSFISVVVLDIAGIKNPSPALVTSSFTATIGTDVSASDSSGSISLSPGAFQSLTINFDPTTVNTTSNMIITATLGNNVSANSTIAVIFPALTWTRGVTPTYLLPVSSVSSCSAITNMAYTIRCSGSSTTITLTNGFSSTLAASTTIKFSINGLFSPPTTEEVSTDAIQVVTYQGPYMIDSSTSTVSGLTPKSVNLTISTPTSFTINTDVVIDFSFLLADSVSRADTVTIQFPASSTVVTNPFTCSISTSPTSIFYNTTTSRLTLPFTTSTTVLAGFNFTLRLRSYRTPSSVRVTDPFTIKIINGLGEKMSGSATISILPKAYSATCSTLNTTINSLTTYTIVFYLADQITSSGYFQLRIPTQLTLSAGLGVQLISTSMTVSPIVEFVNSTVLRLRSLNSSNSNIGVQNVSIRITGLQQPSSVKNISSFIVDIFYSSSNDLVAQATTNTLITTTPGTITTASLSPSSFITSATNVLYSFIIQVPNALPSSSKVVVTVPSTVGLTGGGTCLHQSVATTCTATPASNTISINLLSAVSAGSTINVTYSLLTNPPTTRPTTTFSFATFNSLNEGVDVMGSTPVVTTMTTLSALTGATLTRGSRQNSLSTTYTFMFTQPQAISQSSSFASIVFPIDITVPATISCTSGSATLNCSLVGSTKVNIPFTPTNTANTIYNFTITGIINPYSYRPTPSISITTLTSDLLYGYSSVSAGLQATNNVASSFMALTYNFTNQVLSDITNLVITINMTDSPGYILIQFAASFGVTASSSITCSSSQFVPLCSVLLNNETGLYQLKVVSTSTIPTALTITLSTLTNPSTIPTDYTWVTTYTTDNYKMSQNRNTIQFTTFCTFPCRQCLTTSRTTCTSCYTTNLTNRIYLHQQQCIATCPATYIQDIINFVCQACTLPCYQCSGNVNYCTTCVANSTFKYLNRTATTSTCVSQCPIYMYADLTQIPNLCVDCVSPCRQCTARSICITCVSPYVLYGTSCLTSCPASVSVQINSTCVNCSSSCLTCAVTVNNCTSCPTNQSLYNGSCYTRCPGSLISVSSVCVSCDVSCLTCSITITNCTSCVVNGTYPYYYNFMCLTICPDFYYANTFYNCLSCDALNMGCKNCSDPTVCVSCDPGYVLLNSRCLTTTPDGYLNISGVAVPCQGECATCSNTLTNCTACRSLNLYNNTCQSLCPVGTVPLNRVCQPCTYPCSECVNITTKCTKCATNSSLYLLINNCVTAQNCPNLTYAQSSTQVCTSCVSPCSQCNSSTTCLSCVSGYFYRNQTATCENSCPLRTVGINRVCVACISPCLNCEVLATSCRLCVDGYYYNSHTYQCLSSCPTGQIPNDTIMQCVSCSPPCKTCVNTTDTCLSCNTGTFLSNSLCVTTCPDGQFGATGLCRNCENNCTTCSSAVTCLSCSTPLVLYSNQCLSECPVTHSIVSNQSVCISCTTVVRGCSNCSANGQCYSCYFPFIYYGSVCISSCPDGYVYVNFTCAVKNTTEVILTETLQSYTFPIPFTILGCVVFIACCMSKLQNSNTYMIGILYSLFGLIETGSLAYLIYTYYNLGPKVYILNYLFIMLAVLGAIYILNAFGLLVQTPFLVNDARFSQWLKSENRCFFAFITLLSLLINYKSKMILFTKLFKFHAMNAHLENVYRFRVFNVFSFFGILPQGLALYVCIMLIIKFTFQNSIFHSLLDVIIIYLANILLAVLIVWKPDSFFVEQTEEGIAINKKINVNGDDFSKQAILGDQIQNDIKNHGPESYVMISKSKIMDIEQFSDQLSVSLADKEQPVMNVAFNRTAKVYFSNNTIHEDGQGEQETSNPFRKDGKKDTFEKIHEKQAKSPEKQKQIQNIFSQASEQGQRYSQHEDYKSFKYQSEDPGGSQNLDQRSPRRHSTIVVGPPVNLKTNQATENDDINNKISQRQKQLDQLKKQLDQQEQLRKEKRKSKKKLKKTIDLDPQEHGPSQRKPQVQPEPEPEPEPNPKPKPKPLPKPEPHETSFEEISIVDSSQKQHTHTEDDTYLKTVEQPRNVQLIQEPLQDTIEDHIEQRPRQSIGSWMELRVTEQNKKLPIFSQRLNPQIKTISLPQSEPQQKNEKQINRQNQKQNEIQESEPDQQDHDDQKLPPEKVAEEVDQDGKQFEKNRIKNNEQKSWRPDQSSLQIGETIERDSPGLKSLDKQTLRKDSGRQSVLQKEDQLKQDTINRDTIVQNIFREEKTISEKQIKKKISEPSEESKINDQYSYDQQNLNNQIADSSKQQISERQETKKQKQFYFEQQNNKDFDERAGTRLNFQHLNKTKTVQDSSGLQDSYHEDERINERPISAARKNKIQNSQALLDILAKVEQDKLTTRKSLNHKIPPKQAQDKSFKYSGGPVKSQINEQTGSKEQQIHNRSRMYMAGLSQFQMQEQSKLNRKKTMNYPLNSFKKKSLEDSEMSDSINQIQKSRNKSFNTGPFRKFASRDMTENLDDLGIEHEDYKKNYEELLNQRRLSSERKPETSGSARTSNVKPSSQFRRVNFTRDQSQDIAQDEDFDLNEYYGKQKNKSKEKREKGEKNKSMSKQKSFEETKRIKELERIYLSRR